jgi:hypothetical protein
VRRLTNFKEFVLDHIASRVLSGVIDHPSLNIDEKLGKLAIAILDEKDLEVKNEMIKRYNQLKRINTFDIDISIEDFDYKAQQVIRESINNLFK